MRAQQDPVLPLPHFHPIQMLPREHNSTLPSAEGSALISCYPPSAYTCACMWAAHSRRQTLLDSNPPEFSDGLNLKSLTLLLNAVVSNTRTGYIDLQLK